MKVKLLLLIFLSLTAISCGDSNIDFKGSEVKSFNQGGIEGLELSYGAEEEIFGFVDVNFSVSPSVFKSPSAVLSCDISPALPTGLSIHSKTCVISGTPTEVASGIFRVTVTNSTASSSAEIKISISPGAPTLSYAGVNSSVIEGTPLNIVPFLDTKEVALSSCLISPALPASLIIDNSTCVISGVLNGVHNQSYKVTATNSEGSTEAEVTITVLSSATAPSLSYTPNLVIGTLGNHLSISPVVFQHNGAVTTCSTTLLPHGLVLHTSDCVISGVPAAVTSGTYTVTATNSQGSVTASVQISIEAAAPTLSYSPSSVTGEVNSALPPIQVNLNNGGSPIKTCVISPALPAGLSIHPKSCEISGVPTVSQTQTNYTVTVTNEANKFSTASISIAVSSLTPSLSYSPPIIFGIVGTELSGFSVNLNNGGSQVTNCVASSALPAGILLDPLTCELSGSPSAYQTETNYTITVTNAGGMSASTSITVGVNAPPTLSYSLSGGTNGVVNSEMSVLPTPLLDNGGAITDCYASAAQPLPSYLNLNTTTCEISGRPTSILPATTYTIFAKNQFGVSTPAEVTLLVEAAPPSLDYTGATGTTVAVNSPMSVTPTTLNTNGEALSSCDSTTTLPTGLSVDDSTCEIKGTPSVVMNSAVTYTIRATNSAGSTDAIVTLLVNAAPPSISYPASTIFVNSFINIHPILLTNGSSTTCAMKPNSLPLPSGLGLDSTTCMIYGTPSDLSNESYTIVATNSAGPTEATLNLNVVPNKPTLSYAGATGGSTIVGYEMTVSPTSIHSNGAPILSCTSSPALPDGLNLSSPGCVISGAPSEIPAVSIFTITATNSEGSTSAPVLLRIFGVPTLHISSLVNNTRPVGSCMGPMALTLTYENQLVPLSSFLFVDLVSSGSGEFFNNVNCSGTPITETDIHLLGKSNLFYFKNQTAETVTITADPHQAFGIGAATLENVKTVGTPNTWVANTNPFGVPTARFGHSAVWTGSEMIIWGGSHPTLSYINTGARYNPSTDSWVGVTSTITAPMARVYHSAVWTGTEMIIWGGSGIATFKSGGRYTPSTDSWVATSFNSDLSARVFHSAVWTGTEMIVWGGSSGGQSVTNTGNRYNPNTDSWVGVTSTTDAPAARFRHSAVWTGSEMIIWGGGVPTHLNSGGRYHPGSDSWVGTTNTSGAPQARSNHSAIWTGSEMIIWGGTTGTYQKTGGRYNPLSDSWIATNQTGAPTARTHHSAIWTGTEMIIWGGYLSSNSPTANGVRYNPSNNTWGSSLSLATVPTARYHHSAVWTGTEMILWGGKNSVNLNNGGRYNALTDSWMLEPNTLGAPEARYGHSAVWTGTYMIIWGGETSSSSPLQSGGRYNPVSTVWSPTSTDTGVPLARSFHSAVWDGSEMMIWGGKNNLTNYSDGNRYNPSTDQWMGTLPSLNAPTSRHGHTGIWTDSKMIVWGGYDGVNYFNNGKIFDKTENKWMNDIKLDGAPSERSHHSAIWTGEEMIVWGGTGSSGVLDNGGRYNLDQETWSVTPISTIKDPSRRFGHTAIWDGLQMILWGGKEALVLEDGHIYLP